MIATRLLVLAAALAAVSVGVGFLTGYPSQVGAATAIAVAAFVALVTIRDLAARAGARARPVRRSSARPPLEQLRRLRETLLAAQTSEFLLVRDVRPRFRSIAAMRLARRGIDLDRQSEQARAILGDELWELVRAEGPSSGGGTSAAALPVLIDRLEQI